jgi:hypothetical protein
MPTDADVRETPPELFAELNARFRFTLDVAATHSNHQCPTYYTEHGLFRANIGSDAPSTITERNGLTGAWKDERVYCNPPFSDIAPWVLKAWESEAALVYMLVPATRTEQGWWADLVEPYRDGKGDWLTLEGGPGLHLTTHFLRGRTRFLKDGKRLGSPKFGCVGLLWQR